ncbi:IbrB-like domain-containing protein [Aeromonas allosaccharophila]|uniref:IbrB-like domain-containing protein n=1 Tax=Aeromonas allosaccharophila TaxID=656 RepID=UPI002ADF90D0|nr:ParB/RepB/Spo0J family partition protein [Aeromonas allosaccharophila]
MEHHLTQDSTIIELEMVSSTLDDYLSGLDGNELIMAINKLKSVLANRSPFKHNPIERVQWVNHSQLSPNDYNPNKMAPTERKLLEVSLRENGFTQPIVVQKTNFGFVIIDGYHRYTIAAKNKIIQIRTHGYVPIVILEHDERAALMAATVRHNRARGSHQISLMSELVKELSQLGLTEFDIGEKLGMDADEVLRLKQITGLREIFSNVEFSRAWTVK